MIVTIRECSNTLQCLILLIEVILYKDGGMLATFVRATKESSRQRMYIEKLPLLDYH